MIYRVWAEYLEPEQVLEPQVMSLLKKFDINLCMAFPADGMNDRYERFLKEYEQAGIPVTLWTLLDDNLGYWPSERNAKDFVKHVARVFDWTDSAGARFPWLAVDMELPHYYLKQIKGATDPVSLATTAYNIFKENRDTGRFYDTAATLNKMIEVVHAHGTKVLAAASDFTAVDIAGETISIQDSLETPISPVNWDVVSFMSYTSLMTGYSKGIMKTADARWWMYKVAREMKRVLWNRAGMSIGVTYVGKLEDEKYYEMPDELVPDMQAVKAALIEDISVFCLEGMLRSPRPEEWLEKLTTCVAAHPKTSMKAELFYSLCSSAAKII